MTWQYSAWLQGGHQDKIALVFEGKSRGPDPAAGAMILNIANPPVPRGCRRRRSRAMVAARFGVVGAGYKAARELMRFD